MENQNPTSPPLPPPPPPPEEPDSKRLKTTDSDNKTTERKPRYKRRKVAILFAYCGVGYQGMQKNPGAKTIEGDLEEALYFAGAVPETERGCPNRYDFARSARTDKGVSAVGQVVSGKFYVDPPGFVERLNSNLPDQFRIFGFKRVTPSFSAKKFCDRRRYVYLLPVFALDPGSHCGVGECFECSERGWKVFGAEMMGFDGGVQSGVSSNTLGALSESENLAFLDNGSGCKEELESEPVNGAMDVTDTGEIAGFGGEIKTGVSSNTLGALSESENLAFLDNGSGCKEVLDSVPDNGAMDVTDTGEIAGSGGEIKTGVSSNTFSALSESDGKIEKLGSLDNGNGCEESLNAESVIVEAQSDVVNGVVKENVFRYDDEKRERFNKILKQYEGTHNFHNFTTRTKAADPSANRYIISFHANTTVTVDGMEFVKCEVVGQSFMLHQIRKMIGVAVAIMRNCAPESFIETALQQDVRITVPTAPEVGLYLDECIFSSYNQKWRDTHEEVSMKAYADEAEAFKLKHIYSHIASTEQKEGSVAFWLHSLNHRSYPDLGPEGPATRPE